MTEKGFWRDPYLTRLETRVTGVDGADVTVAETIFFAESGGQESDAGTIGERPVRRARHRGRDIVYTLDADHGLRVGDAVVIEIDWERRYRLMRLHFAAEIVLELAYRRYEGIEKIGAHIAPDKARIDFEWDTSLAPALPGLAEDLRAIVASDQEIESAFSDVTAERRYWRISEFPRVACGGTHLKRTGEIGALRLKRRNPGKGKERIEILLDDAV